MSAPRDGADAPEHEPYTGPPPSQPHPGWPAGPLPPYPPQQAWGQQAWDQQAWGQQAWGQQQWGAPAGDRSWGQPWGWTPPPPPPPAWPRGPGRPPQATAAATLGFVAGGIALLWGLVAVVLLAGSDGGTSSWLGLVVGIPAGAALVLGGTRLLAGRDRWVLVSGGVALALAVLLQAVLSAASSYGSSFGQALLVVFLLPVPAVSAVLGVLPVVGGWVDHVRGRGGPPQPEPQAAPPAW
ncbi:hypothetical protein [Klenkia brasiliensis]|uniref:Uncharacterized protein n=1 Tax=Klenkia brasiliensis TaxID=333142 RepID=A0A1G7XH15_9ACTN|nr:hypothetical protein [Klenkia brasiliensis]SDG83585.1 hypothetical protein SAMN05660324_3659 [Klenkia brasiliensis]